jgi:hypothetical protein
MQQVRRLIVNQRDFVSWENVWRLAQLVVIFQAVAATSGMPIGIILVAVMMTWIIWQLNKF